MEKLCNYSRWICVSRWRKESKLHWNFVIVSLHIKHCVIIYSHTREEKKKHIVNICRWSINYYENATADHRCVCSFIENPPLHYRGDEVYIFMFEEEENNVMREKKRKFCVCFSFWERKIVVISTAKYLLSGIYFYSRERKMSNFIFWREVKKNLSKWKGFGGVYQECFITRITPIN